MKRCNVKLILQVSLIWILTVAGVTLTASPIYAQSDRQRFVTLKPGQVLIDSVTAVECLRWYFGDAVARDSYKQALIDGKKNLLKIKLKYFTIGFGVGALTTTIYIIARK